MTVVGVLPDPSSTFQQESTGPEKEPEDKDEPNFEKEIDRIQKTAEKQLASVHGLNVSLVKKIRKSEAHSAALLSVNKDLEEKNNDLVDKLQRALHENYTLSVRATKLEESEKEFKERASAAVATELAIKKVEARLDSVCSERDDLASKVAGCDVTINELKIQLDEAKEAVDKERESRESDVAERSLQISTLSHEKEKEQQSRGELENQLKVLESKLYTATIALDEAIKEKEGIMKEAVDLKEKADRDLASVREEAAVAMNTHDDLVKQRDDALLEKSKLKLEVQDLQSERDKLTDDVVSRDKELKRVSEEVEEEKHKSQILQSDLAEKTQETRNLVGKVAQLGSECDQLKEKRKELEVLLDEVEKTSEVVKADLKSRSETLNKIEGEHSVLHKERDDLDKKFTDARDKSESLEQEKSELEKRVLQLEELEKELTLAVHKLKIENEGMVSAREKELHEKIAEKEKEFEQQIVVLREELDMVVDRHAESHRIEKGREEAAAAAAAAAAVGKDAASSTEPGGGEASRDVEVLEPVINDSVPGLTTAENFPDQVPEETVIVLDKPGDEHEGIGATDDTNWRSLEVPTEVPASPLPYDAPRDDYEEEIDDNGGVAVMTRTIDEEEDDDEEVTDDDEEVTDDGEENMVGDEEVMEDGDSVEGETKPSNMVISEEVVEEVVVDKHVSAEDIAPRKMPAAVPGEEVDTALLETGEKNRPPTVVTTDIGIATSDPGVNTEREVVPVNDEKLVSAPEAEATRDVGEMVPPPHTKKGKEKWRKRICCG